MITGWASFIHFGIWTLLEVKSWVIGFSHKAAVVFSGLRVSVEVASHSPTRSFISIVTLVKVPDLLQSSAPHRGCLSNEQDIPEEGRNLRAAIKQRCRGKWGKWVLLTRLMCKHVWEPQPGRAEVRTHAPPVRLHTADAWVGWSLNSVSLPGLYSHVLWGLYHQQTYCLWICAVRFYLLFVLKSLTLHKQKSWHDVVILVTVISNPVLTVSGVTLVCDI